MMNSSSFASSSPSKSNSMALQVYMEFKDVGFSPTFVALHGFRWAIAITGLGLDILLLLVTFRTKSLQGPCNLLIAFGAASSAIFQLGPNVSLFLALRGINFMHLMDCFMLQSLPLLGISLSLCFTLFIGLDRLLCASWPIWHNSLPKWPYVLCMVGLSFGYALLHLFFCWRVCALWGDLQVMCTINVDCYQGWSDASMISSAFGINLMTVAIYAALWFAIRHKSPAEHSHSVRGLLKSVSRIFFLNILGWSIACSARLIFPLLALSPFESVIFANLLGYATNLACASTLPVLFICSEQYRMAILKMFGRKGNNIIHLQQAKNKQMQTTT